MSEGRKRLRLMTYLSPDVPVQLFELMRDFLEATTGRHASLVYESRWPGPPPDRPDPFTADDIDIAFMSSTAYLKEREGGRKSMELCSAAPLHSHPLATGRAVYFSELVVHESNKERFKDFYALKGCRWAYNREMSMSGNVVMLSELKKHGYNANFFGSTTDSGSHLNSIKLVLNGRADAAAIDSNVLNGYKHSHPENAESLHRVMSLGPIPIYPIIFNSSMPGELKQQIVTSLLEMERQPAWAQRFLQLGIVGYTPVDESFYGMELEMQKSVKNMSLQPAYY